MKNKWTDEEFRAAVEAYRDMQRKELNKIPFVKSHYYTALAERFDRTLKSFEYRMQNISYVYSVMGRSWVTGLKPAKNVGARNLNKIQNIIEEIEGQQSSSLLEREPKLTEKLQYETQAAGINPAGVVIADSVSPLGVVSPKTRDITASGFTRNSDVKNWVLKQAKGQCECCNKSAPFLTMDGEPFLEVHHVKRLADNGTDTITNAIAVCPNCHRALHYSTNKTELTLSLYINIPRLVME